jgi:phosphoribosylanthranilate isomerase
MNKGKIAVKICGMRYPDNVADVASLNPDYLGFILFEGSPRYIKLIEAKHLAQALPSSIRKVAVIVDEPLESAKKIASGGTFDFIQLHGDESPDYCRELSQYTELIKAFRISGKLPENLEAYEPYCKLFLFDTAGSAIGGTGLKFDHRILKSYSLEKGYFVGGGISPDDSDYFKTTKNNRIEGVDLNSRFEFSPGLKNVELLKHFITNIRMQDDNN